MPGMEARAPERTETSRGLFRSPNFLPLVDLAAVFVILGAGFGGDGEALGNGHADVGHLGQVGTLAAQQLTHLGVAFGEQVNVLFAHLVFPF